MNALPPLTPQRPGAGPTKLPNSASTPAGWGAVPGGAETVRAPTPATLAPRANFSQALLNAQRAEPTPAPARPKEPSAKAPNDETSDTSRIQRNQLRQAAAAKALADRAAQRRLQPGGPGHAPAPGVLSSGRLKAGLGPDEGAGTLGRSKAQQGDLSDGADALPPHPTGSLRHGAAHSNTNFSGSDNADAAGAGLRRSGFAAHEDAKAAQRHADTAEQQALGARRAADAAGAAETAAAQGAHNRSQASAQTAAHHGVRSGDHSGAPTSAETGSGNGTDNGTRSNDDGTTGRTARGHRLGAAQGASRWHSVGETGRANLGAAGADSANGLGPHHDSAAGAGSARASFTGNGNSSGIGNSVGVGNANGLGSDRGHWGPTSRLGEPALGINAAANSFVSSSTPDALVPTPSGEPNAPIDPFGAGLANAHSPGGGVTVLAGAPLANPLTAGGEPNPGAWAAAGGANAWAAAGAQTPALGNATSQTEGAGDPHIQAHPGSADFAREVGATIALRVQEGVQQARLQLSPAELGPVWVQIQIEGQAATVHLAAAQADTRAALEQALPTLAGQLSEAGFTLAGGGVSAQAQAGAGGPGFSDNGWTHDRNAPGDGKPVALGGPGEFMSTDLAAPARWQGPRGLVDLIA
jgi:flagellar hook-length control protein FliK